MKVTELTKALLAARREDRELVKQFAKENSRACDMDKPRHRCDDQHPETVKG